MGHRPGGPGPLISFSRRAAAAYDLHYPPPYPPEGVMVVPLIEHDRYLLVPLQSALTDTELSELHAAVLVRVGEEHPRGVVIDVALLDVLDAYAVRTLSDVGRWARRCGVPTVVVGVRSEVAQAMDRFGLAFHEVATASNWAEGLKVLADGA